MPDARTVLHPTAASAHDPPRTATAVGRRAHRSWTTGSDPEGPATMWGIYDDHGIRFEYPPGWELELAADGARVTIELHSPGGTSFAFLSVDPDRPAPAELVDEALEAMRAEYPTLDAVPTLETIDGHHAVGYDVEFLALDIANSCVLRSFRTPRRTVFLFAQWSDLDGEEPEGLLLTFRRSLEETDFDLADIDHDADADAS